MSEPECHQDKATWLLSFTGALPRLIIRRLVKGENSRGGEGPLQRRAGDIGSEEVVVEEKSQGGLWEMSGVELEQVFWDGDALRWFFRLLPLCYFAFCYFCLALFHQLTQVDAFTAHWHCGQVLLIYLFIFSHNEDLYLPFVSKCELIQLLLNDSISLLINQIKIDGFSL